MREFFKSEIQKLESSSLLRKIPHISKHGKYIECDGKRYLNLSSNDYLGFACDKSVTNEFIKNFNGSFGSASSRLLTGNDTIYNKFENYLAQIYKKESALLFNSGYHANVGITSALLSPNDIVFSDKLNHASIIDGIRLSGCEFKRYKHLDYDDLESKLKKYRKLHKNAIIISESLFSMDGDIADLKKLVRLKKEFNCLLIIDEAHAFGVFGKNGLGVCEQTETTEEIDIIVATFGKAIASMGAFCVCDEVIKNYLVNKARSFIFSTVLPEANIAFSHFVLTKILPEKRHLVSKLFENVKFLISIAPHLWHNESSTKSYIIPIIIGANEQCVQKCEILKEKGFYLLPVRHPTVPLNTARIRLSLRADIEKEELQQLAKLLNKF